MLKSKKPTVGFRAWITRNGVRMYAKDYGLKAWPITNSRKTK